MSRRKSKKKARRPRDQRRRAGEEALRRRTRDLLRGREVRFAPARDGVKMSEVLEAFVEPYREIIDTKDAYRTLLTVAVVAWNVSLFPENEREPAVREALDVLPAEVRAEGERTIRDLMLRKEKLFSKYRRGILDFELIDVGEHWHLSVTSTITPEPGEPRSGPLQEQS